LIEKGRKFSDENVRVVEDPSQFATLELLQKGLDFRTIELIQESDKNNLSDIDKVIIAKKLSGSTLSQQELREVLEGDYKLLKDEDGNYDSLDADTKRGLLKLRMEAENAEKSIKEYKDRLAEKNDPTQKLAVQKAEKVKEWSGKLPGIVENSKVITFDLKVGEEPYSYAVSPEEQNGMAELAKQIVETWAEAGIEGTPEQIKHAIQSNYFYQKRNKILSAFATKISTKKNEEFHKEIHNPTGLQTPTEERQTTKGGLDLLLG